MITTKGTSIIIVPDLHGRSFWRAALMDVPKDTQVVFLGDYLDPYGDERIYWSDAFKSLQDIIALKKAHPEQITLLFGNHDLHYLFPSLRGSRYNMCKEDIIRKTFEENMDCFQMATECIVGGKRYFFTHAGLHADWLKLYSNLFESGGKVTADTFNQIMFTDEFVEALGDVSPLRGGLCSAGSMIWADIGEYAWSGTDDSDFEYYDEDMVQIIGHTKQLDGKPVTIGNTICVDCLKAFVLDEDGLRELK